MFSQLFLFSLPILPPPSFASFYFAFFLYFLFRIFPLVIITNSPSCCSYHEIYISTLPYLTLTQIHLLYKQWVIFHPSIFTITCAGHIWSNIYAQVSPYLCFN